MPLRSRPALGLILALIALASCVGGDSPLGLSEIEPALSLSIRPSLLPEEVGGAPAPVNRIRAVVERLPDGEVLGTTVVDVSSTAGSWEIVLNVEMDGGHVQAVVSFQLIYVDGSGNETIQYSGRTAPLTLSAGTTANPTTAEVVRGPLDNLSVTDIEITGAPTTLVEGDGVTLETLVSKSDPAASPVVFWALLETGIASMAGTTVHGQLPGVVHVVASAGSHSDTVAIDVVARPDHVKITPDFRLVQGPGVELVFMGQVMDRRGNEISGESLNWQTPTPDILELLGSGLFRTRKAGRGVVEATAVADPTLKAEAEVVVEAIGTDIALTKAGSKSSVMEGEEVDFTLTIRNVGRLGVDEVAVIDSLPLGMEVVEPVPQGMTFQDGVGTWSVGTLAAGATASITVRTRVAAGTAGETLQNVAWCQPGPDFQDSNPFNDRAAAPVSVMRPKADLRVSKTVDQPVALEGDTVTFQIFVRNEGPSDAEMVRVLEELPAGVRLVEFNRSVGTFDAATGDWAFALPAGQEARLSVAVAIEAGTAGTTLVNVAQIVETEGLTDPVSTNDAGEASVAVSDEPPADVVVEKTVDNPTPSVGDMVTFTLKVINKGPSDATNVTVFDTLPTGLDSLNLVVPPGVVSPGTGFASVDTLRVGDTITATYQAAVAPGTGGATLLNRFFKVAQDQPDPDAANDTTQASVTVTGTPVDLTVLKSVAPTNPTETDTVTFTVRVANPGLDDATNVLVRDLVPPPFNPVVTATPGVGSYDPGTGDWTIPTLLAGDTATLTLIAVVADGSGGTSPANSAFLVSLDQTDPVSSNDTATVIVAVQKRVLDLQVLKTVDLTLPVEGEQVQYQVSVVNLGPGTATSIAIADTLPALIPADSFQVSTGTVTGPQWTIPTLAEGDTARMTAFATVQVGAAGTYISNTAALEALAQQDTATANNTASITTFSPLSLPPTVSILSPLDGATYDPGETIQFDGTASDPEDGSLTATIAWTSDRSGLIGTGGSFSSFTLSPGPHTIAATVTDATGTVAADTVNIVLAIVGAPVSLNVPFGGTASLPISLSAPAPAGGLALTVTAADPAVADPITSALVIPAGALSANATIQGLTPGTTDITVVSVGYGSATTNVSVTAALNILTTTLNFPEGYDGNFTVRLESLGTPIAAPTGGLSVTLTPADPTCVAPTSPVTIPEGLVQATATVSYGGSATTPCNTTVTASATSVTSDNISVTVNPPPGFTVYTSQVGTGLQTYQSVYLGYGNHGGVTVRLESSDPSTLLVSPNASTPGTPFIDVPVANGVTWFTYYGQGVEGATVPATIPVTASTTGFTDGSGDWTVEQAMYSIGGLNSSSTTFSPDNPFYVSVGVAYSTYVSAQAIRAGGTEATVTLTSSDPAIAQLTTTAGSGGTATVPIPVGSSNSSTTVASGGVAFSPLGAGIATVSASIPGMVAAPDATRDVTVSAPGITVYGTRIGTGLQVPQYLYLGAPDHGGVTVRVESTDPSTLLISPDATTPGTDFIDVFMADGSTSLSYYAQGVEGATVPATVSVTATAAGFTTGSGDWTVEQAMYSISGLNATSTTFSPDDAFYVTVGVAYATYVSAQAIRAGGSEATVTLTSSDPGVGQLTTTLGSSGTATVTIPVGSYNSPTTVASGGVAFDPLAAGPTTVSASIPGYAAAPDASREVTVSAPGITVYTGRVGTGLQASQSIYLGAPDHGGVTVRVESTDPSSLLISPDATTPGTAFIDVPVADGYTYLSYYAQGVEGATIPATVPVTATATGFNTGSGDWTVEQAMYSISGLGLTPTTFSPDDPFYVSVGVAYSTYVSGQAIRAGGTAATVTLTSSVAAVGQLTTTSGSTGSATVTIPVGSINSPTTVASGGVAFDPLAAGNTTVTASIPGFVAAVDATRSVTVSAPGITVYTGTVGAGLQTYQSVYLGASDHGGVTVRLTSSAPGVLQLSPDAATAGSTFIDVFVPNGGSSLSYYAQGVEGATGTVAVTASAPGFTDGSGTWTVIQPSLAITSLSSNPAVGAADDPFTVRVGIPYSTYVTAQAIRAGGTAVTATITSSDPTSGTLTTLAGSAGTRTVQIQPGSYDSPTTVAGGGVAFDPLTTGSTTVTASIPGFLQTPAATVAVVINP